MMLMNLLLFYEVCTHASVAFEASISNINKIDIKVNGEDTSDDIDKLADQSDDNMKATLELLVDKFDKLEGIMNKFISNSSSMPGAQCNNTGNTEAKLDLLAGKFDKFEDIMNKFYTHNSSMTGAQCNNTVTNSPNHPKNTAPASITPVKAECLKHEGFVEDSNQCFKLFKSRQSWHASKKICEDNGLELAKPNDPKSLRKLLVEDNADYYAWIGLRGTGSHMQWIRDGTNFVNDSIWWEDVEPNTATNFCTGILTEQSHLDRQPERPYWNADCSTRPLYGLCELVG